MKNDQNEKNEKSEKSYYLGLDIGTDSVGYAVTDTTSEYNLLKFHGEPMWGVHLFDAADTKAGRRAFRTARRRLDRRQQRVRLIQELFADEIGKVDPKFYHRIQESALLRTDAEDQYCLFDDDSITDKTYHQKYPTIHHLLVDLMHSKEPRDVRLIYLACAWLVAHRGHFLYDISTEGEFKADFEQVYSQLTDYYSENGYDNPWASVDTTKLAAIIKEKLGLTKKEAKLKDVLYPNGKCPKGINPDDNYPFSQDQVVKLLAGRVSKLKDLFGKEEYADLEQNSVSLGMDDDKLDTVLREIGDDAELIVRLKAIYDWGILFEILGDNECVSEAKVKSYDKHKSDLKDLKYIIRKYLRKEYDSMFNTIEKGCANYVAYSGYCTKAKGAKQDFKRASREDFLAFVKGKLGKISDVDNKDGKRLERILEDIERGTFMPKQVTGENRVIPYQLYYKELKTILENASSYLPFLNSVSEGLSVKDKILSVMEFRIPYYVGPLNSHSQYAWIERKAEGRILPWNFEEKVDLDASEQNFINRMISRCTYFPDEKVVPKHSLLYEKFEVLNEINNLTLNGKRIDVSAKQSIFDGLFKERAKVSVKRIKDHLRIHCGCTEEDVATLAGIDEQGGIKSSLSSYHKFRRLIQEGRLTETDVELIIGRATISESKTRFAKWLDREYSKLPADDLKYIKKMNFADFGRLSKKFLTEFEGADKTTGEINTIMGFMWIKNVNIMELLARDKYTFAEKLEEYLQEYYSDRRIPLEERLDEMYISNSVKRPIYRTLDVISDVVKAMKTPPEKMFIEMARGATPDAKGKRTKSRKDQILELYKAVRDEDLPRLKEELDAMGDGANNKLQSEALFLYYMQLGKCMYSGQPIDLAKLGDGTYNIDHIYPQSIVKDDSLLNNKVLVLSEYNHSKGDTYPVPSEWRKNMFSFWQMLKNHGLITAEKFERLTRKTGFDENEEWGFINRQLVETRQATKALATILKEKYPDTEIVYVKAGLVSDFRHDYGFLKCRSVNDLHHAKDAFLNVICGNVYNEHFTHAWFKKVKESGGKYNVNFTKLLGEFKTKRKSEALPDGHIRTTEERVLDEQGNPIFAGKTVLNGNKIVWNGCESFASISAVLEKNNIHVTQYAYCRKGGLFDQQPLKATDGLVPRKKELPAGKYGGYRKPSISFFVMAKYKTGKKTDIMITPIEVMWASRFLADETFAKEYIKSRIESISGKAVSDVELPLGMRPLKINTCLLVDGFCYNISAIMNYGTRIIISPAVQLILSQQDERYIKRIEAFVEKAQQNPKYQLDETFDRISTKENVRLFKTLLEKLEIGIYTKRTNIPVDVMKQGREKFIELSVMEQAKTLLEIVKLFGRVSGGVDLRSIGGKANVGATNVSSTFSNLIKYKEVIIVEQSPAGLWTKRSENLLELL